MWLNRKLAIFVFYTIDSILHSGLIVGWSSISDDYRERGFFCGNETLDECDRGEQGASIGLVFLVALATLGPVQFFFALINDYVSFGLSRIIVYVGLIISYLVLGLAEPGSSNLLYVWALQFPCGLSK